MKKQVYALCKMVPRGKVTTYREIGKKLGTKGFQAVGQILRCNPYAPEVSCHRVVKSSGEISGYHGSDSGNIRKKIKLLEKEGVLVKEGKVDLEKFLFRF